MLATIDGHVQILLGSSWTDITDKVIGPRTGYITIKRGLRDEQTRVSTSTADFTLNNRDGNFSPRNPVGDYHGSIGRDTPIRIFLPPVHGAGGQGATGTSLTAAGVEAPLGGTRINYWQAISNDAETFNITVPVPYTPGTERDGTYGTTRTGIRTIAAPGDQTESVATSSATVDRSAGMSITIPGTVTIAEEVVGSNVTTTDITLNVSASAAPGDYLLIFNSWDVEAGEEIAMPDDGEQWYRINETVDIGTRVAAWWRPVTVAGAVAITIGPPPLVLIENHARVLRLTGVDPYTMPAADAYRFQGVVPSWPGEWDLTGNDAWVTVRAVGVFGRLQSGARELQSAIRREMTRTGMDDLVAYVPMEDGSGATMLASAIPGHPAATIYGAGITLASDSESFPGSRPLPTVQSGGSVRIVIPPFTFTDTVSLRAMFKVPAAGWTNQAVMMDCFGTGTTRRIAVRYVTGGNLSVSAYDKADVLQDTDTIGFDVRGTRFMLCLDLIQVGADITYNIYVREIRPDGSIQDGGLGGTFSGLTLTAPNLLVIGNGGLLIDGTIGHAMVGTSTSLTSSLTESMVGYAGEPAGERILRLTGEEGLLFDFVGDYTDTELCGPQRTGTIMSLLEDAANADRGMLYESRWEATTVAYRTRKSLYGQDALLTLDYSASHLSAVPRPGDETATIRNVAIGSRRGGISGVRAERTDGPLGTDTIGEYEATGVSDLNVYRDSQVLPIAEWETALGTVDEDRYPELPVELSRAPFRADADLSARAQAVELGDKIKLTGMPQDKGIYWDPTGLTLGYQERFENLRWLLTYNTRPSAPFDVAIADDDAARLDTTYSELYTAIDADDTTVDFRVEGARWTVEDAHFASGGLRIKMGGEEMTVTDILPPAALTMQVGTVAHANNASVSPALPASVQSGDLLLLFAAIRNSGTGTVTTPGGWQRILGFGGVNCALFGKVAGSSESAPTVTFSGGVANADTSAQIARWRGGRYSATANLAGLTGITRGYAAVLNPSAQNIAVAGLPVQERYWLIVQVGWKQDDWTSVTPPTGGTEIDEPDTTTGDDQGITWAWREQGSTPASIAADAFTVTGGASAISRSLIVGFANDVQRFTVTRSVNGVVKSHAAGAAMSLARPAIAAL